MDLDNFWTNGILDPNRPCEATPLPIELAAFSGKATAGGNTLTWATAADHTCAAFEVQRRHTDGIFRTIGTVESQRSPTGATYHFTDPTPVGAEKAYYRLRLLEDHADPTYSNLICLGAAIAAGTPAPYYPNPLTATDDQLLIPALSALDHVEAYNALGQRVLAQVATGAPHESISFTGLPAALYTVVVTHARTRQRTVQKVMKL